jgi:hypothetical protein
MDDDKLIIRRGEHIGKPTGWTPESEADHYCRCPGCGAWIDMRDLAQAFEHAGPLPHSAASAEN